MRVVLHADASPTMGTGHVTRCLALGAELHRHGAQVSLATSAPIDQLTARAANVGIKVVSRDRAPADPDWIVVDGYHFDAGDRTRLADPGVPRLVIDDVGGERDHAATIVLNQNLYATSAGPTVATANTELLAGPAYALLGPEYRDTDPVQTERAPSPRILVTMGGADPHNATAVVLAALEELSPVSDVRVIIGPAHPRPEQIEHTARAAGYDVVREAPSIAPHLDWCDIVVIACGTSVLEATRFGRGMVGVILADNQEAVADALAREGFGVIAGRHPGIRPAALARAIAALRDDAALRLHASTAGPGRVDGRGASRVVRAMMTGALGLREATQEDAAMLLEWRMDPAARVASFDRTSIDPGKHVAWLRRQLVSPSARIWIGHLRDEPVGVVRFSLDGQRATMSVSLDKSRRTSGLGTRLISMGCSRVAESGEIEAVDAWIRPNNIGSERAFRRANFRPETSDLSDRRLLRLRLRPMR